ncbi:hypothetical protein V5799_015932 [Amblyomma americanum]|uniref:Uncharacterized protein n=1 Tax=Amblyomma americanum TaxID=6943 RepID=A0AAQ4F7X6_AMBAM
MGKESDIASFFFTASKVSTAAEDHKLSFQPCHDDSHAKVRVNECDIYLSLSKESPKIVMNFGGNETTTARTCGARQLNEK